MTALPEPALAFLPLVCMHSISDPAPSSCNACRSKALQDYQAAKKRAEREAAHERAAALKMLADKRDRAFAAYEDYRLTHYRHLSRWDQAMMLRTDPRFAALSSAHEQAEDEYEKLANA